MASKKGQRHADYCLYDWQIRAIRRIASGRGERPSDVVKELLTQALRSELEARPQTRALIHENIAL